MFLQFPEFSSTVCGSYLWLSALHGLDVIQTCLNPRARKSPLAATSMQPCGASSIDTERSQQVYLPKKFEKVCICISL